jgi:sec-independent protein translocase protein TatB
MFDIGWSELLVIAVVAIVVIGPKDLPRAMRAVGRWSGKIKRMAREFQSQFNEAIREAELDEVKKQVTEIANIDPMADLKNDLSKTEAGIRSDLAAPVMTGPNPASTNGAAANGADTELAELAADSRVDEPAPEPAQDKSPLASETAPAAAESPR